MANVHFWEKFTPATSPSGRCYPICETDMRTGKTYFGQGFTPGVVKVDWYEFDPVTEVFTTLEPFPAAGRPGCQTFIYGDYIYMSNGCDLDALPSYPDVWRYSITNDTWEQMEDKPGDQVTGGASFVIGNYGYVVSGYVITNTNPMEGHDSAQVWRYDFANDSWTQLADYPGTPMSDCTSFCNGKQAVVAFGTDDSIPAALDEVWLFDPVDGWSQITATNIIALTKPRAISIGSKAYVFGGFTAAGLFNWTHWDGAYEFDWNTMEFTLLPNPPTENVDACGVGTDLDGNFYAFHGRYAPATHTNQIIKRWNDMATVYEVFDLNDRTQTGKVIGNFTIDFCKTLAGAAVSQSGMTLTELGVGKYVLGNPNITERTAIGIYLTGDNTKGATIMMDPIDGDIGRQATLENATYGLSALNDAIAAVEAGGGVQLTDTVEGTLTLQHVLRIMLAALAGKTTGGGTTAPKFRDAADSKNRISATVDSSGNRTAVTLDGA